MGKYFGTDGIRGKANEKLTADLALKVGAYLGHMHQGKKLLIAEDTRRSSRFLAHALAAGASAYGADVYMLGVAPTPACAYLIESQGFAGGVMISASHNPFEDNGLKCFDHTGSKIDASFEAAIESYIDGLREIEVAQASEIGRIIDYSEGLSAYIQHLEGAFAPTLSDYSIVLDCAHGAAVTTARHVFEDLGARLIVMNETPDGLNINVDAGSTHLDGIIAKVKETGADMGFAFDGDADRMLAVDDQGNVVDGDAILYLLGRHFAATGHLEDRTVVSTVMANLGFTKSMAQADLHVVTTQVGDKHVYQAMKDFGHMLGGEQSGHIILKEYATTGDGVLTALAVASVVKDTGRRLSDLRSECAIFPQLLENLKVTDKHQLMEHPVIMEQIERITHELGDTGRILVRPSGTEDLIRVMVEAESMQLCEKHVRDMIGVIKELENR